MVTVIETRTRRIFGIPFTRTIVHTVPTYVGDSDYDTIGDLVPVTLDPERFSPVGTPFWDVMDAMGTVIGGVHTHETDPMAVLRAFRRGNTERAAEARSTRRAMTETNRYARSLNLGN